VVNVKPKATNSPPHRWLRKILVLSLQVLKYSPPHRWLRKECF
jgi:hypothetical protein